MGGEQFPQSPVIQRLHLQKRPGLRGDIPVPYRPLKERGPGRSQLRGGAAYVPRNGPCEGEPVVAAPENLHRLQHAALYAGEHSPGVFRLSGIPENKIPENRVLRLHGELRQKIDRRYPSVRGRAVVHHASRFSELEDFGPVRVPCTLTRRK